ncbi:MAG: hypothetical protein ACXWKG_18655, partial [Limisphaerales bacterium]
MNFQLHISQLRRRACETCCTQPELAFKTIANSHWLLCMLIVFPFLASGLSLPANAQHWSNPTNQHIPHERILSTDHRGILVLCGGTQSISSAESSQLTPAAKPSPPPPPTVLPTGMRAWACVPSVLRADGLDSFRLEVDVNGAVSNVVLTLTSDFLQFVSGTNTQNLHDDGLNGDRVAADKIFTSEQIIFKSIWSLPANMFYDTNSPAGLHYENLGFCHIIETNGVTNDFLIYPTVGILSTNVPLIQTVHLNTNVVASPHLINVSTGSRQSQKALRQSTFSGMDTVTAPVYSVLPDVFDFFTFLSVDHAEYFPGQSANAVAGAHIQTRVNYTGTGLTTNDSTAYFGSNGRLLGISILDVVGRGISANICTHELLHQWVSFT